ncbi:chorismate synthase [Methylocella sp.]|uniref:chorismate synthase n=1 Tax=Methylocella sp. TaxID=1978226 RepID=UPI0037843545
MSHNSFGHLFRVTTFGESHGPALGCVVDGCPAGLKLSEADIQPFLDRRKPGQSRFTTQRREADAVKILSGVFEDASTGGQVTTGTPIALLIENTDQRSKDYAAIAAAYRPGHADYVYDAKYGVRDYRGGGRSSARETAARVAAGAVARKVVPGVSIRGALIQIGPHAIDRANWDWAEVDRNPFFCPDAKAAALFEGYLDGVRKSGSSVGAVIEIVAEGVPVGWGAPVYGKLDADLCAALMSINAVKGVEIGEGFSAAALSGEENADEMRMGNDGRPLFLSNHAGGILGGVSTGQPIVARFAVKPTSSILTPRRSLDRFGAEVEIVTKGRHDPCVGIRAVPVGEAMAAIVLADHFLRARGQQGETPAWPFAPPDATPLRGEAV